MKILIIEAYTAANIGSGALVENSISLLNENFPKAKVEILAQNPDSIARLTGLPTYPELFTLPLRRPRLQQVFWLLITGSWMAAQSVAFALRKLCLNIPESFYTFDDDRLRALRKIKEADMIVSVGAERINDNFYKAILFSLFMLWVAQKYGKFLILFPQTIGPFHFTLTKALSASILNHCDIIFLRDEKSRDILNEIGVRGPKIVGACDVAVMQSRISADDGQRLLAGAVDTDGNRPLVGISAMKWSYIKAQGKSGYSEYKDVLARVADDLVERKSAKILFLATNVLTEGCREDDVAAATEIVQLMKYKDDACVLDTLYSPSQMKGIMGLLDLCLVTRMHACIFATGACTPTVSINYQFKLHEYMKLVGLEDYTIDIDRVTYETLSAIVDRAWSNLPRMREILEEKVHSLTQQLSAAMGQLPPHYHRRTRLCTTNP